MPETRSLGNALIADVLNAVLAEEFFQAEPIAGIALVEVTQLPGDRVRVAITGTDAPPVAEVRSDGGSLVFGLAAGTIAADEEEAIEIVVTGDQDEGYNPSSATTATRTDTPLRDIPQSITVVPREVLDNRNVRTVSEAVETVSSVARGFRPYGNVPIFGSSIIRGFVNLPSCIYSAMPNPIALKFGVRSRSKNPQCALAAVSKCLASSECRQDSGNGFFGILASNPPHNHSFHAQKEDEILKQYLVSAHLELIYKVNLKQLTV